MKYESNIELRAEIINEGVETTMGETIRGMRGYKVFNSDWTCNGYQYSCPGVFEDNAEPVLCDRGFHFCRKISDCFSYYDFNPNNKVAEIEALGDISPHYSINSTKYCTNKIEIIRELSWEEVLFLANIGDKCHGRNNVGNYNVGDENIGSCNIGEYNVGIVNKGDFNVGDNNVGDYNIGDDNFGDFNVGYFNCGSHNVGCNNTGDYNTGDWNSASHCTGCFMDKEQPLYMFNKPTDFTYSDWEHSAAHNILEELACEPIDQHDIDAQIPDGYKKLEVHSETTGIKFGVCNPRCGIQKRWDELSKEEKQCVLDLPNFDKYIFYATTGIRVE